eukprot:6867976-Alexandrium_andersonii.AAC.1
MPARKEGHWQPRREADRLEHGARRRTCSGSCCRRRCGRGLGLQHGRPVLGAHILWKGSCRSLHGLPGSTRVPQLRRGPLGGLRVPQHRQGRLDLRLLSLLQLLRQLVGAEPEWWAVALEEVAADGVREDIQPKGRELRQDHPIACKAAPLGHGEAVADR